MPKKYKYCSVPITCSDLLEHNACSSARNYIERKGSLEKAWTDCDIAHWMLWVFDHFPNTEYLPKIKEAGILFSKDKYVNPDDLQKLKNTRSVRRAVDLLMDVCASDMFVLPDYIRKVVPTFPTKKRKVLVNAGE